MAEENKFPTIRNLRDALTVIIERGLGSLPVQIVVAPDSTIQVLAESEGPQHKPAIMIEYPVPNSAFGISFISTSRLEGGSGSMPSTKRQ